MPLAPLPPEDAAPARRPDGAEARERLLHTALRLFSERGFARTSTREIALAAEVNVAAIRYYFGDKAGLYRATFTEPMGAARDVIALFAPPHLTLRQSMQAYFAGFTAPLKQGELARQCLRLHIREMLEPTSQWAEEMEQDAVGPHLALVEVLGRHLGVAGADDDLHRLAFAIGGMGIHLFVGQDIIDASRPALLSTPEAIDGWAARLVDNALALVAAERTRRRSSPRARTAAAARPAPPTPAPTPAPTPTAAAAAPRKRSAPPSRPTAPRPPPPERPSTRKAAA